MPFTLTMPKLSPTMEQGTIAKWHKRIGERIEPEELLMEVSTDKATVEYNALDGGFLRKIIVQEGQEASVNQPIAIFTEKADESIEGYKPEGETPPAPAQQPVIESANVQPIEQKAPSTPTPIRSQPTFVPEAPLTPKSGAAASLGSGQRVKASPLAKKIAQEKGLDLAGIQGTGPGNRIVSRDLEGKHPTGINVFGRNDLPEIAPGSYEEESLTPMRKVISQRLQDAKSYIPHFYVSMKINAEPLLMLREQLKSHDIKVTINDLIIKAAALALRQHPDVNSGFNSSTNSIIRFKTIDISVAVSLPTGLITPIIRHADYKNLGEISSEVKALAARAKEGKLEMHEFKGGSFTISNLGMYGVSEFIAIINPPQAAILAVSGIANVPAVRNGQIVPGQEMTLTLSGDHRVIDGVAGAEFLRTLQRIMESPALLLI